MAKSKIILLDSDVISHFMSTAKIDLLPHILGAGERACLAIARYEKDVIASSNFRDVADYCEEYSIEHIGVMDILTIAVRRNIFTIADCNKFIHDAIVINDAKFPVAKYEDYTPTRNLDEFCTPLP